MTWEQLSLFTDEELGLQGPKVIEKTVAIQLAELREEIARTIEDKLEGMLPPIDDLDYAVYQALDWAAAVARGNHAKSE
jgi:hypothetical protein